MFTPLTRLCRDACDYCTFAQPPVAGRRSYMRMEEVLQVASLGTQQGCAEILFTLGAALLAGTHLSSSEPYRAASRAMHFTAQPARHVLCAQCHASYTAQRKRLAVLHTLQGSARSLPLRISSARLCHVCANVWDQPEPGWTWRQSPGACGRWAQPGPKHLACKALCVRAGDKPEQLYPEARQELRALGYESTLEYAADAAGTVMRETGLLPHINAGTMGLAEVVRALLDHWQCI